MALAGLVLAGCSHVGVEGVGSPEPSGEPTVEMKIVDADGDGYLDWPDGVIGRGYVIPSQPVGAPPLPQWVKDFNPEMPALAREPSEEGAKAFAEYVFASDFYEFNTGTTLIARSLVDKTYEDRLKQLDETDGLIGNGKWGRIDELKMIGTSVELEGDQKYFIRVKYAISPPYPNSKDLSSLGLIEHEGGVMLVFDRDHGWKVHELAYANGTFNQYLEDK
ncbi:DUF6318 family protein [Boudabousia marimammalium]|uniref:DUF6318 family protein n=1 Tax=Boudabousia marimammalium TaxID=156892 RepID=UPI00130181CE|nr:DUF6318 family protein [Boudabousia marimammalium]